MAGALTQLAPSFVVQRLFDDKVMPHNFPRAFERRMVEHALRRRCGAQHCGE
jgi:hypothetical protein